MMDSLEYSAESRIDQLLSFNCLCGCLHVFILDTRLVKRGGSETTDTIWRHMLN